MILCRKPFIKFRYMFKISSKNIVRNTDVQNFVCEICQNTNFTFLIVAKEDPIASLQGDNA